eukprot:6212425-Pleurochrysis_carterae.AAC.10
MGAARRLAWTTYAHNSACQRRVLTVLAQRRSQEKGPRIRGSRAAWGISSVALAIGMELILRRMLAACARRICASGVADAPRMTGGRLLFKRDRSFDAIALGRRNAAALRLQVLAAESCALAPADSERDERLVGGVTERVERLCEHGARAGGGKGEELGQRDGGVGHQRRHHGALADRRRLSRSHHEEARSTPHLCKPARAYRVLALELGLQRLARAPDLERAHHGPAARVDADQPVVVARVGLEHRHAVEAAQIAQTQAQLVADLSDATTRKTTLKSVGKRGCACPAAETSQP